MNTNHAYGLLILCFFVSTWMVTGNIYGQTLQTKSDSFLEIIQGDNPDSTRAKAAFQLARELSVRNPDSGIALVKTWLPICEAEEWESLSLFGTVVLALNFESKGYIDSTFAITTRLLSHPDLSDFIHPENIPSRVWLMRANVHQTYSDYSAAIEAILKGVQFARQGKDSVLLFEGYSLLGAMYWEINEIHIARSYYEQGINLAMQLGKVDQAGGLLGNMAVIYRQMGKPDSALYAYRTSNRIFAAQQNLWDLCISYHNLTVFYLFDVRYNYDSAAFYFERAAELIPVIANPSMTFGHVNIGVYLATDQQDWQMGQYFLDSAETILAQLPPEQVRPRGQFYHARSQFYEAKGDFQAALADTRRSYAIKDSALSQQQREAMEQWRARYELVDKRNQILELAEKNLQQALTLQARDQQVTILILALVLLAIVGGVWFLFNRQREQLRQQKAIYQAIAETEVAEQSRIARDLHDGMGALLATLAQKVAPTSGSNLAEREAYGLARQASEEMRRISHNLMPLDLQKFGLAIALESLLGRFRTEHLHTQLHLFGQVDALPSLVQLQVYRIIQELVRNAEKHGQASEITVQLTQHLHHLNILVADNGVGFEPTEVQEGLGLQSLKNRVRLLNGNIYIDSQPQAGSSISLDIPFKQT